MESLHYLLMRAHTTLHQRISSQAAESGITSGQPKILEYLSQNEGCEQKKIATYCKIEPATVCNILARMENAELIVRKQKSGNRRSLYVYLTEKGKMAAHKMELIFDNADKWAAQGLSEKETERLKFLLEKVCSTIDNMD